MAKKIFTKPISDGYYACTSWSQTNNIWIVWPERNSNWRLGAKPIQNTIINLIKELSIYEKINLIVSKNQYYNVNNYFDNNIRLIEMTTNDCFIYDYGPLFLINKENKKSRAIISKYNAFGGEEFGLYYPYNHDQLVALKICNTQQIDYYEIPFIFDWSMIVIDGNGTCFASCEGILSENINPNITKEQAEYYLKNYLNVIQIIWIPNCLPFDFIRGRLDHIFTFINCKTILLSWTDMFINENYTVVAEIYKILKNCTNINNEKYIIIKVPFPQIAERSKSEKWMIETSSDHLCSELNLKLIGSYTNMIVTTKCVIFPTFGDDKTEGLVMKTLKNILPDKVIINVKSREFLLGHATIKSIFCFENKS